MLIEADDEWQGTDRRYLSEGSMALLLNQGQQEVAHMPMTVLPPRVCRVVLI
jgi:hypothetical protein